ncbi:DUF4298 domain-containing protein [Mannheimia sp. AT1]|uniref:DUF4298 domain-containing protein n=1 Tax=Mannheimia cairinae TaxID=3025936 RepID=A0ABT5MP10_9PAST|nr:DUF4298 domain-containing protein [Mannheimia cairinae]MDD0823331.1 DUF4298 domain-containing protein [Mannheimia cairinae]MDD0827061.1 DUF4298 domain-containing protein [Mannheimia cairinae]
MKKINIQEMQNLYNEWMDLLPELEKGLAQWKKANELLEPLNQFYSTPEWQELHHSFDEPLETKGHYSVLSEDAVWNALAEQHQLAIEYLKVVTKILAKE